MSGDLGASKLNWGDVEDDEDDNAGGDDMAFLPPNKEEIAQDGVRTLTSYKKDEKGDIIKMVQKTRKVTSRKRISVAAIKRRQLKKFGECKNKPRGVEAGITFVAIEPLEFEWLGEAHEANEDDLEQKSEDVIKLERQLNNINKSGTSRNKLAAWNLKNRSNLGQDASTSGAALGIGNRPGGPRSNVYVPLGRRGGGRGSDDEEEYTIVITNLPEETTRDDIKAMLGACVNSYGRPVRERGIWGFERETNTVRFYRRIADKHIEAYCCFCSFTTERDANIVIDTLDKHKYGGLVLGVQRTPSRRQMETIRNNQGGEGGLRPRFGAKTVDPSKRVIPGLSSPLDTSARRHVG